MQKIYLGQYIKAEEVPLIDINITLVNVFKDCSIALLYKVENFSFSDLLSFYLKTIDHLNLLYNAVVSVLSSFAIISYFNYVLAGMCLFLAVP